MTTTKLGDEFLHIPKLDVSGSNWVLYKERFFWALDAHAILEHVDETGKEPKDPILSEIRTKVTEEAPFNWRTKEIRSWMEERIKGIEAGWSCCETTGSPRLTIMKIWTKLTEQYLERTWKPFSKSIAYGLNWSLKVYQGTAMCWERRHDYPFCNLVNYERRSSCNGTTIKWKWFLCHNIRFLIYVIQSIYICHQHYLQCPRKDQTEEYECRNSKNKSGKKEENAAFYSNESEKDGKGGLSSKSKKKNVECHNCHKKAISPSAGHLVEEKMAKDQSRKEKGSWKKSRGRMATRRSQNHLPKPRAKRKRRGWCSLVGHDWWDWDIGWAE